MFINPFWFPPRQIPTVGAALYVLHLYDAQIQANVDVSTVPQEALDAIADVMLQKYPDLAVDLDQLIANAKLVGQLQGVRQDLDTIKQQFRDGLPVAIRKALDQPIQ